MSILPTNGPQNINSAKDLDQLQAGMTKGKSKQFRYQDITYSICMNKPKGFFKNPTFKIRRLNADGSTAEKITAETFNKNKKTFFNAINEDAMEVYGKELKDIQTHPDSLDRTKIQTLAGHIKAIAETSKKPEDFKNLNDINELELKSNIPMEDKLPILKELRDRCNNDELPDDVRNGAEAVLLDYAEKSGQDYSLEDKLATAEKLLNRDQAKPFLRPDQRINIIGMLQHIAENDSKLGDIDTLAANSLLMNATTQLDSRCDTLTGQLSSGNLNSEKRLEFVGELQIIATNSSTPTHIKNKALNGLGEAVKQLESKYQALSEKLKANAPNVSLEQRLETMKELRSLRNDLTVSLESLLKAKKQRFKQLQGQLQQQPNKEQLQEQFKNDLNDKLSKMDATLLEMDAILLEKHGNDLKPDEKQRIFEELNDISIDESNTDNQKKAAELMNKETSRLVNKFKGLIEGNNLSTKILLKKLKEMREIAKEPFMQNLEDPDATWQYIRNGEASLLQSLLNGISQLQSPEKPQIMEELIAFEKNLKTNQKIFDENGNAIEFKDENGELIEAQGKVREILNKEYKEVLDNLEKNLQNPKQNPLGLSSDGRAGLIKELKLMAQDKSADTTTIRDKAKTLLKNDQANIKKEYEKLANNPKAQKNNTLKDLNKICGDENAPIGLKKKAMDFQIKQYGETLKDKKLDKEKRTTIEDNMLEICKNKNVPTEIKALAMDFFFKQYGETLKDKNLGAMKRATIELGMSEIWKAGNASPETKQKVANFLINTYSERIKDPNYTGDKLSMLKTLQEIFDDPNLSASMEKKNKDLLINLLLREDIRKLVDQQSQGSELKSHELEQIKNNLEKISVDKGASPDAKQTAIAWLFDINLKKLDNNSLDPEKKLQIFTELKKLLDASELPENKQNAMKSLTAKSREILDNNTVDKEIQKTAASWLLNEGINLLKKEGIDLSEKQSIATDMIQILQHSNPKPATDITNQIREQAADLLIRANKAILKDPSFQDNRQFYANDIRYLLTNHSSLGIENLPQETKQMAIDLLLDKDLSGLNNFSNLQQNEKDQIMNGLLWITNNQNASVESKQKAVHLLMEIYGKILQEETTDQNNKSKILNALSSLSQNPNANQLDKEWVTELTKYYQNQMNPNYQSQYSQMTQNYQYPQNQGNPNFPANQYSQIQNPASQSQNQPNPNFQNSQNPNYSQNQYPSQNQGNPNQYFPSQNLPANQYSKTNQTQGNSNYQNQSQYSQMPQNPASQNQPNPASPNYQNPNYQNPANPNPANQFPSQPNPNFPNPNPSQGSPNPQNQGNPNQ